MIGDAGAPTDSPTASKTVFGVITATYNRPLTLAAAVQSVRDQSYQEWRMVVIDDSGSGLATHDLERSDPRITVHVNKVNVGTNRSRNVGLDALLEHVDYITFLDDDDRFSPEALEASARFISRTGAKWAVSRRINADSGVSFTEVTEGQEEYDFVYDCMVERRLRGDATHLIAADILRRSGARFPDEQQYLSEWRFWATVGSLTTAHFFEGATTLGANYEDDNLSTVSSRNVDFRTREIVDLYEFFSRQAVPDTKRKAVATMFRSEIALILPRAIAMRRLDLARQIIRASEPSHLLVNKALYRRLLRLPTAGVRNRLSAIFGSKQAR